MLIRFALALVLTTTLGLVSASVAVAAGPSDYSFTGNFGADDDVQLFTFIADGTSTVTIATLGYAGGVQSDSNIVLDGGFDPVLTLFDAADAYVLRDDDSGSTNDPTTGQSWDALISMVLPAGNYTVALTQWDNYALGSDLSDGFARTGQPNFTATLSGCSNGQFCDANNSNRTSAWAVDFSNVEVTSPVPEPSTSLLVGLGLAWLGARRNSVRR